MNSDQHQETAFIGRVTASVTHEIRNVLAIVKESAGLIDDLVASIKQGTPDPEKITRALERIDIQVARGTEIIQALNRVAHSMDHATDAIDLNSELEHLALLYRPFTRRKRHELDVKRASGDLTLSTNHLQLQMSLFEVMESCLEQIPEGGTLTLRPGADRGTIWLELTAAGGNGEVSLSGIDQPKRDRLSNLLSGVNARLDEAESGRGVRVNFQVPEP